jgi:heat shock protein HslJ
MKTIWILLALSATALVFSACAPAGGSSAALPGTKWELTSLSGATPASGTSVTLFFGNDDKAGGDAGCNNYSGTYKVSGSSLTFGPMVSTMMACQPPIMDQEQAFLKALGATKSYEATADQLTLKDGSGNVLAVFAPYKPASLAGTWQAIGINNGKQAVVSVLNGTTVTAIFGADGSLSGNGGCNSYNSTYKVDGDKITIGAVAATRMACAQDVMDQEQAYFTALANATTYSLSKNTLELRDATGALQVDYTAQK